MEEKRSTVTDFTLDIPADRDVRILQLTDIQTIHLDGVRETPRRYPDSSGQRRIFLG